MPIGIGVTEDGRLRAKRAKYTSINWNSKGPCALEKAIGPLGDISCITPAWEIINCVMPDEVQLLVALRQMEVIKLHYGKR